MKLGIGARLLLASLVVIGVSVLTADAWLRNALVDELGQRIESELRVRAALAAEVASTFGGDVNQRAGWDALADRIGHESGARITLLSRSGTVLGDSELSIDEIVRSPGHADRPEIRSAIEGRDGVVVRESGTLGRRMMYVARVFEGRGGAGIARAALPLTQVDDAVARLRRLLFLATLLSLAVAVLLSGAGAHWASRHASFFSEAARRMADGDLSTRTNARGTDEFSELGRALDRLAASFSTTLAELRTERDLVGGILSGMAEGVLLIDDRGLVKLLNPALREMLLLGQDAVGHELSGLVDDAELKAIVERAHSSAGAITGEIELGGLKPRRLLVRATALAGEPGGILAVFVDVTDLRRLETLRRDFVANVSHELRTPVTAIRSAAETLGDAARNDPPAVPMFVNIIDRNAERLQHLVEDLLDLSRLESREYRLELVALDLAASATQAIALFHERSTKKGVVLQQQVASIVPRVRADRRALEQVFTNLLENAIKYCPAGASIRVLATDDEPGLVRISVADSGPGIEAKHLPRLFERFYRIDKGRSRDIGGTGLGLSIVKHLVEAMGGSVGVDSTPGTGSTFWFTLPRADAATSHLTVVSV